MSVMDPVHRLAAKLNLEAEVQERARRIFEHAARAPAGHEPATLAAAAVSMGAFLCRVGRTEAEIARAAGLPLALLERQVELLAEQVDVDVLL